MRMLAVMTNARAAPFVGLALTAVAACGLSGCGANYASSAPVVAGDYRERHPIVVASAPTRLDIYPAGVALDARAIGNIRAFVDRYQHYGSGEIVLLAPAGNGSNSKAIAEVRRALLNAGLRGKIFVGSYSPPDRSLAAPIRLSFVGLKAVVTTPCGQWPEDLASGSSLEGWKNESYANFGCATQSMLAAQVADPRDFVTARALDPSDVAMRTRAIEAVRNGEDPGTQWKDTKLNPIGADLPSTGSQ